MKKIEINKNNLIDYEKKEKKKQKFIKNYKFETIDYIIGTLFLTQMNMYCKINSFSAHGYYIAYALMIMFNEFNEMFRNDNKIESEVISYFWVSLTANINYLKGKVELSPTIDQQAKKNIINNLSKFMSEISLIFNKLILSNNKYFLETKEEKETEKYKLIESVYNSFFYMLLITAKYFGSGEYKDCNLIRLSEYYSNIFLIYYKSKNTSLENNDVELLDMFIGNQAKLNTSLYELNLNSDTLDEIIEYLSVEINDNISLK